MKLKNEVLWLNWKRNQCSCNGAHLSLTGTNWRSRSSQIAGLRYKHTERQASSGSFEVLTLGLTLGNGSGTNFGASQCIPMGPCHCRRHWRCCLTLSVFIPLGSVSTWRRWCVFCQFYLSSCVCNTFENHISHFKRYGDGIKSLCRCYKVRMDP